MKLENIKDYHKTSYFYDYLKSLCEKRPELKVHKIGEADDMSILTILLEADEAKKTLVIIGGIHGDEPAGPYGIAAWLRRGRYPSDINVMCVPLLNPTGFDKKTRENAGGRDLNRGLNKKMKPAKELQVLLKSLAEESIDFVLTLHEDGEHKGVYLYSSSKDLKPLCKDILLAASQHIPINTNDKIFGDNAENGMIFDDSSKPKHIHSIEYYVEQKGIDCITFETPQNVDLQVRIKAQVETIGAVIQHLQN